MQRVARFFMLSAPAGTMRVALWGNTLSSMTAKPPSTFFSTALTVAAVASKPVIVKNDRRSEAFSPSLATFVQTVETCHATCHIDTVCLRIDAMRLAVSCTKSA